MNRILFEHAEMADGIATFGGERAAHVMEVLHGEIGQIIKTGEIDGLVGTSEIVAIDGAGTDRLALTVRTHHTERALEPWVDLILAPPRPRVMKRLLPQLATLGVGRIVLVGAKKVEKDFWGATLLKEENYRPLLIDGLMQAGTARLPTILCRRNFRRFITDELDFLLPSSRRLVAHPYAPSISKPLNFHTSTLPNPSTTLAIGPEGGWTDDEVDFLESHGFARHSLGPRILRTDTATIALLARLMPDA